MSAPISPLLPQITVWADDAALPDADPMRLMLTSMAARSDRQDVLMASFGPDAGRLAAAEARREIAGAMGRLMWNVGALRWGLVALSLLLAGMIGWGAARFVPMETDLGAMPPAMASVLPWQDWGNQWAACRPQTPGPGYEWCLLPVVTKVVPPVMPKP